MKKIKLLLMLAAMSMSVVMQAMQVYVNIPGQSQQTIEMEPSDSFENLKSKIETRTSIPEASQSLFFNGILMLDDHTLYQDGVTSGSTLDLVIGEVHTSLQMDDVIKFGDKLNIPVPGEYNYFGISGESCLYANNPYTLVRGNIVGDNHWDWTVTEAADGAYYIFKDVNGDLHPSHAKMAATSSTDGLAVDEVSSMDEGLYHYFMIVHQRTNEFVDNVDGIEAGLAALVGQTTNLAISRQFYMDGYFNTICLPISLDAAAIAAHYWLGYGSEIFEFESATVNGGTLDLYINQVTSIEAGKPYLVRWAPDLDPTIPGLYFEGVTIEASVGQAVGTGVQFVGSMGQTQLPNGDENYLFVGANNTLYWPNTDNKLKGFRAYFKVSGDVAPHGAPARMIIRNAPTGVENEQSAAVSAKKVLRDGQLIILRNGVEYNAQGQIVK